MDDKSLQIPDFSNEERKYYKSTHGFDPAVAKLGDFFNTGNLYYYEACFDLPNDPDLTDLQICAVVTFDVTGKAKNRIVVRDGETGNRGIVQCIHTAVYEGPLDDKPPDEDLARSTEGHLIDLPPEEHFASLKSYVSGMADFGLQNIFTTSYTNSQYNPASPTTGFNAALQRQLGNVLGNVAPKKFAATGISIMQKISETTPRSWLERHDDIIMNALGIHPKMYCKDIDILSELLHVPVFGNNALNKCVYSIKNIDELETIATIIDPSLKNNNDINAMIEAIEKHLPEERRQAYKNDVSMMLTSNLSTCSDRATYEKITRGIPSLKGEIDMMCAKNVTDEESIIDLAYATTGQHFANYDNAAAAIRDSLDENAVGLFNAKLTNFELIEHPDKVTPADAEAMLHRALFPDKLRRARIDDAIVTNAVKLTNDKKLLARVLTFWPEVLVSINETRGPTLTDDEIIEKFIVGAPARTRTAVARIASSTRPRVALELSRDKSVSVQRELANNFTASKVADSIITNLWNAGDDKTRIKIMDRDLIRHDEIGEYPGYEQYIPELRNKSLVCDLLNTQLAPETVLELLDGPIASEINFDIAGSPTAVDLRVLERLLNSGDELVKTYLATNPELSENGAAFERAIKDKEIRAYIVNYNTDWMQHLDEITPALEGNELFAATLYMTRQDAIERDEEMSRFFSERWPDLRRKTDLFKSTGKMSEPSWE